MTREEAIKRLKLTDACDVDLCEALEMAIKALEQEPCEDCVSKDAVLDLVADYDLSMGQVVKGIHNLPPVTAQPKMGYWFIDERPESDREVVCSNCDQPIFKYHKLDFDYRPKYCPNCGAKMSEIPTGSEGSDKE